MLQLIILVAIVSVFFRRPFLGGYHSWRPMGYRPWGMMGHRPPMHSFGPDFMGGPRPPMGGPRRGRF